MRINQPSELTQFGINDGHPDTANLANERLAKKGLTGQLAIRLTKCFDEEIDLFFKKRHAVGHGKQTSSSGPEGNT